MGKLKRKKREKGVRVLVDSDGEEKEFDQYGEQLQNQEAEEGQNSEPTIMK